MRARFRAAGVVAVVGAVAFAGCGDDGGSASADPERLCDLFAQGDDADALNATLDILNDAADVAPDEIRDDLELVLDKTRDNFDLLANVSEDPEGLSADEQAELEELLDDEEVLAADKNVTAWQEDNCDGSDDTTVTGDDEDVTDSTGNSTGNNEDDAGGATDDATTSATDGGPGIIAAGDSGTTTGECRYLGVDDTTGDMRVELTSTSEFSDKSDLNITYALRDANQARLATSTAYWELVSPGETVRQQDDSFEPRPRDVADAEIDCVVIEVALSSFGIPHEAPVDSDGCEYAGVDEFGDVQLEAQATNPFAGNGDVSVVFAVRDGDGARILTASEYVEAAAPGEALRIQADTFTEPPEGVVESEISCDVVGIRPLGY